MADYENSEEIEASCEDQDLLQADLNLRTTRWTNTSAVVLNEEPNEVQGEVCDSVVEEIVVEQANENYLSCIDDDCIEDSIVYVFEEPVVEFELNDSAYVIQEPEETEMNSDCTQGANKGDDTVCEEVETSQFENNDESVTKCSENELIVNKCTVGMPISSDNLKTYNKESDSLDNNLEKSYDLPNEMEEDTFIQGESSDAEDGSASNVLIGPLLPNQIPDYVPEPDNDGNTSHQSPKVSAPSETPDVTPPSLLSALSKNNLTPLRKAVLLNESSPLETKSPSSESSISPALKTLGKDQIKKRLQSFSLMKQGIQPIPIKKILNPKQPKVHTTIEEVYDEIGRKTEEKLILKKPPKQGPTPSEKARQVINEIEQIKREEQEIYEQTLMYMKHSMRDAHSRRSKFYRDRDRSRSKSPIRRERKYEKEMPKRPRKISEDDKFRRSLENDKRITENDPRMIENDRRITESDRRMSENDRRISESDRRMSETDRRISESDRRMSENDRRMTDSDRRMTESDRRKSPEIARRKILEIPKLEKKKIEKPEPPKEEEMPRSWTEIKKKNMDFVKIKRIKQRIFRFSNKPIITPIRNNNKKGKKKKNQQQLQQQQFAIKKEDVVKPQLIFETPSVLRTPIIASPISGHPKCFPPEVLRFTEKLPEIVYSENPNSSNDFFRNRKQVLSEIPEERAEIMMKIIENKLEPIKPGRYVEGVWYPSKDYLEESKNPIESVTSYGLSVLSEMYDDEQEEIQEPVATEKDETEKDETETKNKEEKKKSKKKHKHKSKSRSSSEERTHKQKKQKKKKRSKKKKNKKEKSPSTEEITKPELEAEKKKDEKEDSTPNTEEYRSNWESDEEFLNDIIPGDRSFSRKNVGKNWEIEDKFEEKQYDGKEQRKHRRNSPDDRRKDTYMDLEEISPPVPEEKISSKRSNNREIDDFEYHTSNIRLEERSFSRQSYEKREFICEYEEKSSRRLDKDEFSLSSSSMSKSEERAQHFEPEKKNEPHRKSLDRKYEERKDKYMDYEEVSLPVPEEKISSKRSNNREIGEFQYHTSNIRPEERSFSRQNYEKRESKCDYEEKSSRRSDKDEFRRSSSSLTKSEESTQFESEKRNEPDRYKKSLDGKYEERKDKYMDYEEISLPVPEEKISSKRSNNREIDDFEYHSSNIRLEERSFSRQSYEKRESKSEYEEKSSRRSDKDEFRRSSSSLTKSEESTHFESEKKSEPDRHRKLVDRKHEEERRHHSVEKKKSIDYKEDKSKIGPETRKYEQETRKYEPENRKYEQESRKCEPENRKYDQENRKYELENRKHEPENRKYEQENRKYEQENKKYEPENRKYEPENRKYEPEIRKYEQEIRKYEPETRKYEPETRKYELETRKYEQENRKYELETRKNEPENRKYEAENRKYEQEHRKYDLEQETRKYEPETRKYEPENRKYEQENRKYEPENRKYEPENRKYEKENRKYDQENKKYETEDRKYEQENRKYELDNRKYEPENKKFQEYEHKNPNIEAEAKSYSKEKQKLKEDIKKSDEKSRHSIESDIKPRELERKSSKDRKHDTKDNKREEKKAPYHKWSSDEDLHKTNKQDRRKFEDKHTQNIELNLNYKKYQKSQWSSDEEFVRTKDKYEVAQQFDRRRNYEDDRDKSRWHNEESDIYNKYNKIVSLLDGNLVNLKDLERNRKLAEGKRNKSDEKSRKSDERDHKKEKYDKKDDKHKKNKKKSREKKEKSKKPKVQINYSEDEESYDEDFKTAKQKSLAVENAKKYAAKIKIDYSDFDLSLSECKDKYDKKFDGSRNPSPDKNIDTPLTPKERKINIDLSEIIVDQTVTKTEVDVDTISIPSPETPKTSVSEIVILDTPEIIDINDSPILETPISAKITEEFNTPKNKKAESVLEVTGVTPIIRKENTTPLLATPVPSVEMISPVAPPILPIPKPIIDLPITPVIQDSSKLVSEYEEFMKAVSFDEPKEEEIIIQEKQPDIPEIEDKQPEIPLEIVEQAEKKDSESSVEESSSEYDSSEPDTSSESDSSDSEIQTDKMLEIVANIKTEKITDSEESQDSKTDKRKRDDSVEKEIKTNVVVKIENDAKKQKVEEIPSFECETKYDNVIDWEKSYTNNVEIPNKSILDICDIMSSSILPENIPLPNENTVETIAIPDILPPELQSPKEVITISSDSSTPSPVKKSRSFIPIKLLTAESRKQANETAQFIPSDQDQSPGFGKFAPKDILSQDVESCSDLNQTDINEQGLQGDTLENCRKRQSQWNLNITPAKKPLLQPSALAEDDSDEDFTDKFIKPDKKIEQDKKEGPIKEKLEISPKELEKIETPVLDKKDDKKPELKRSKEEEDKSRKIDKPKEKHHSPDRHKDDHRLRRSPPRNLQEIRPPRRPSRDRYDRPRPQSPERKRDRSRDRGLRDLRDIRDPRERERELREREKRRLSDRRPPERKPAPPRGKSPRTRYSRERELQRARPRERSRERPRPPERERERSRERIRERSRDRDHRERIERRDYRRDERRFSRSPSPHRKEIIPGPHPRMDDTDFSTTSMDIVQSPVNSPLDGFKRSLADSTISDSELITQLNTPDESNEQSPAYTHLPPQQYFPPQVQEVPPKTRQSPSSPKRISLDDRINLVLGIEKEPPKSIDTVCTRGSYSNPPPNYDPYGYNRTEYDVYSTQPPPDRYAPPPYNQYQYQNYPPPSHNTDNNVKVVQVGNVIQVVPTEQPPPIIQPPIAQPPIVQPPIIQPPIVQPQPPIVQPQPPIVQQPIVQPPVPKPEQPKVVQVGNMLQIVPVTIMETNTATVPMSPVATIAQIEEKPIIVSPPKMTEQIAAERRAEKEKRRQEREARRQEKERKRKEKEKRRQLKIKTKMDNMVKKALELETGEGDLDMSNTEEPAPETNDNNNFPVSWPPASSLTTPSLPKPPSKGILVTHGFREKDESLDDSTETRKVVKFADGICPGEGTSPSAGEDLPSPPPPPRKLPKEKRYKKVKNKNKKKIKVKIIRTQQQTPDDDSSSEDNLPPPPPPPGSPPPHLWPPRIKQPPVNNIHPQVLTFPTPPPPQVLYPPAFPPMGPMTHAPPPPPPRQHHPPVMPVLQTGPPPPPSHHGAHQTSFHH